MSLHPRTDWTGTLAADSTLFVPASVVGAAVHWNGPAVPLSALTDPRSYLEGVRRFHVNGNGWSDIAYNLAVDQTGDEWTLRGLGHRSAANGDTAVNDTHVAILAIIGQGQIPSAAMLAGIRSAVARVRVRYPRATAIVGHQDIRPEPTACPGPDLQRAVNAGQLEPEDDMPTVKELIDGLTEALRDPENPYTKQVRRNTREVVQIELVDERNKANPGQ